MKIRPVNFPRNPHEDHRVATPLELFFDLVYVVAIASAGVGLHHALLEGHMAMGISWYIISFFAIWWCWMNFTWYSSAYDSEDNVFTLITFLQIFGALVMAVGISSFFTEKHDLAIPLTGYVIMRVAMIFHWLRAAKFDPKHRTTCLIYAFGILGVQICWVLGYVLGITTNLFIMGLLWFIEIAVPVIAERFSDDGGTPWHPHHIAERYSLLVIIVLGEGVLACTAAIGSLISSEVYWQEALILGFGAASLIFSIWWSYFKMPFAEILHANRKSRFIPFVFGYGHVIIFCSLAALGVGIQVVADYSKIPPVTSISQEFALSAVAIPRLSIWFCLPITATA